MQFFQQPIVRLNYTKNDLGLEIPFLTNIKALDLYKQSAKYGRLANLGEGK